MNHPSTIYVFGSFGGSGHHLYMADRRDVDHLRALLPALDHIPPGRDEQVEGQIHETPPIPGWSYVAWWDRQDDRRGNSHTGILAKGSWTVDQLLEAARRLTPWALRVPVQHPSLTVEASCPDPSHPVAFPVFPSAAKALAAPLATAAGCADSATATATPTSSGLGPVTAAPKPAEDGASGAAGRKTRETGTCSTASPATTEPTPAELRDQVEECLLVLLRFGRECFFLPAGWSPGPGGEQAVSRWLRALDEISDGELHDVLPILEQEIVQVRLERQRVILTEAPRLSGVPISLAISPAFAAALKLVIDGIAPLLECSKVISALDPEEQQALQPLYLALNRRIDRERRDAAVIARVQAMSEAAAWNAARRGPM